MLSRPTIEFLEAVVTSAMHISFITHFLLCARSQSESGSHSHSWVCEIILSASELCIRAHEEGRARTETRVDFYRGSLFSCQMEKVSRPEGL